MEKILRGILLFIVAACLGYIAACSDIPSEEFVFFDFESEAEFDRFHWKCHTLPSLSEEGVTHGEKSLQLEFYPSAYPGLASKLVKNDWRGYEGLSFDIYNPENEEIPITVRIDDRKEIPDYRDRYNKDFILKPGINTIDIPLNTLITSGTRRPLNVKRIYRFLLFMVRPQKKTVLYLDYIRLHP